jgi:tetratricopeptide (TPR) repeat protein
MRAVLVSATLLLALGAGSPAVAQTTGPTPESKRPAAEGPRSPARQQLSGTPLKAVEEPGARAKRLDDLFAQLRQEASAAKAGAIANKINAEWFNSGSATIDLLVQRATQAVAKQDNAAAFDFLDQAIILDPDYAEAWNRRATLNYATDHYSQSLDDIRETLKREPRHYGALMGLAAIMEETDRKPQALQTYFKVLEIYPTLKGAQDAVGRLSDELSGQAL